MQRSMWIGLGAAGAWLGWRWMRRARYSLRGRSVLITGGSRGLGLVLARTFAAEGAHLTLVARDEEELARARADLRSRDPEVEALTVACDVSDPRQVRQAVERAVARYGRLDVVVNVAGIISVGPFEHMGRDDFVESLDVHLFGPLHVTDASLPYLREAPGGGRIVNVSSIGGRIGVPHLSAYCAGKFALVGFSDALRAELRRHGVRVTTVCPGLMRTGSPPHARFKGRFRAEHAWFAVSDSLPLATVSAERAARQIVAACRRGDARLTISLPARLAAVADALAPGLTGAVAGVVARLLPEAEPALGTESWTGFEAASRWAPSVLTRLSDAAALRNNELRGNGAP